MKVFISATVSLVSLVIMPGVMAVGSGSGGTNGTLSVDVGNITVALPVIWEILPSPLMWRGLQG